MPDPRPDDPAADPAPTEETTVRRLLAGARHDGGVPDDVAARLDARLDDLVAERDATTAPTDLSARRRRRRAGAALLVAAAAVVAVGIGVGEVVGPSSDDAGGSSANLADRGAAASSAPSDEAGATSRNREPDPPSVQESALPGGEGDASIVPLVKVRSTRFVADVRSARDRLGADGRADYRGEVLREPRGLRCDPGPYGRGFLVGVRYDGSPSVLAFRAPTSDTQVAELLQCGTGDVLRSATLSLR